MTFSRDMKPNGIILHHSLTDDSYTASWPVIKSYHMNELRWSDIGYHYGIESIRGHEEILLGRFIDAKGAHCKGHNSNTIGICFVGNFDNYDVPAARWDLGVRLCKFLVKHFDIKTIDGHRDFNPNKSCPGKRFNVGKFRRDVFL